MGKIIISTDSTADLSLELIRENDIKVFSMTVVMGDETRRDGMDIHTKDVFEYTKSTGKLTSTSAGNIADYEEYFNSIKGDGDEVIHFSLGSGFSSTHNNARLAADDMDGVYVIDSANLSTGQGLLVLKAVDMLKEGKSAREIVDVITDTVDKVRASFVLDTLEYMKKGGRCSSVVALGANLLKLKPCIEVQSGKMGVTKKYRGKISDVYKQYIKEQLEGKQNLDTARVFITHTCLYNEDDAKAMVQFVRDMNLFDEVIETTAGCTVSVHCGPATLGVLFIEKTNNE